MNPLIATTLLATTIALTTSLTGCVTTDYVGKSYTQTTSVDLYFDESEITRPHEIMGSIRSEAPDLLTFEQMEQELIKKAMAKGADAVLIVNMDTVTVGSTTNSYGKDTGDPTYYLDDNMNLKTKGGHDNWSSSSYTTQQKDKVLTGKLIKYK